MPGALSYEEFDLSTFHAVSPAREARASQSSTLPPPPPLPRQSRGGVVESKTNLTVFQQLARLGLVPNFGPYARAMTQDEPAQSKAEDKKPSAKMKSRPAPFPSVFSEPKSPAEIPLPNRYVRNLPPPSLWCARQTLLVWVVVRWSASVALAEQRAKRTEPRFSRTTMGV